MTTPEDIGALTAAMDVGFKSIQDTLGEHTRILGEHTRILKSIQNELQGQAATNKAVREAFEELKRRPATL